MTNAHQLIHSSKSSEWYTPRNVIERAQTLLGTIDLDPASCTQANEVVQATKFYTKGQNGLTFPWRGKVWLNPPSSRTDGGVRPWVEKLLSAHEVGDVPEALLLVNAVPDRQWFHPLWRWPICFFYQRLKFWGPADKDQPTHPSALVYFPPTGNLYSRTEQFSQAFEDLGYICIP